MDDEYREFFEMFTEGWDHFLKCIDFRHSFLDARAITFMNEIGLKEGKINRLREGA
jgi:hypothetical protein